ncbi:MAG: 2,3-bisphosphoglycerate-dependent phosphoglycerate mutase [Crocinitomix sp.]|jgi:2,3-bisphosphoglycerate-dependent phosphoglycerate mutase
MKLLSKLVLFIFIFTVGLTLSNCKKEPVVEIQTVTVYDTVFVSTTDTIIETIYIPDEVDVTSFIFVKHAEKELVGSDPELTAEGVERADKLAYILSENELDRVYSTDFNRTMQTATPTATDQGLTVTTYGGFEHDLVIDDVLENLTGGKVLIVGHSNTVPNFLNALTGSSSYMDISEEVFDNLFVVSVKLVGDSKVVHLKY